MIRQVHILGASGSGTTTLGRAIQQRWGYAHLDTDNFFWELTDPPFERPRERSERVRLLSEAVQAHEAWVLTGSLCGWGDVFIPQFELVVFLYVPPDVRLERLRHRESRRYGGRIELGGELYRKNLEFMAWAASYDHAEDDRRSLRTHEAWLKTLSCPVIRLEGEMSVEERLKGLELYLHNTQQLG